MKTTELIEKTPILVGGRGEWKRGGGGVKIPLDESKKKFYH